MSSTIAECLAKADALNASDSARLDVELLLGYVLNKSRSYLFAWPEKELAPQQFSKFEKLFERRQQGEPIAYIIGCQGFWNLELEVNASTLIPRPETELLVELALDKAQSESRILDLGTGTGAIALSLASELPQARVTGVDRVGEAVELAKKNKTLNAISNVEFLQSNWFSELDGHFDLIVSNPPYVQLGDPHLEQGDLRYEPHTALTSGADGLDDIRKIIRDSKNYLHDGGWLLIEHGFDQAEAVQFEFAKCAYEHIQTFKDLSRNDRVTAARLKE